MHSNIQIQIEKRKVLLRNNTNKNKTGRKTTGEAEAF